MTDLRALGFVDELRARRGRPRGGRLPRLPVSTARPLALRAHPGVRVRVLLDERSAGFFAMGMAKRRGGRWRSS